MNCPTMKAMRTIWFLQHLWGLVVVTGGLVPRVPLDFRTPVSDTNALALRWRYAGATAGNRRSEGK